MNYLLATKLGKSARKFRWWENLIGKDWLSLWDRARNDCCYINDFTFINRQKLNSYKSQINNKYQMLRKYFQDYDSQQDQNYVPSANENRQYDQQHQKKSRSKRPATQSAHQLYLQLKQEYKKSLDPPAQTITNPIELANKILNSQSIKPNKRITFAGKQYILNEQTGQLEPIQRKSIPQLTHHIPKNQHEALQIQIKNRHISYQYLNHVMQAIYNRSKKINAIGKSKLDWKGFVRQEGIEDRLQYNRKGGVLKNLEFMNK